MRTHLPLLLAASLLCAAAVAAPRPAMAAGPDARADVESALPFVANDYATVLADARQRHVPVFIENWAMW